MNFQEAINPLNELLVANNFSVSKKSIHFIEYSSKVTTIRIGYSDLEHLFNTYVGQNAKSLIELTPNVVKEVFKDDSFKFQSTLTIENLISFFKGTGNSLLHGDKNIFKCLNEFSEQQASEYTRQILHSQNIQDADKAWAEKDYPNFIKCVDRTEKDLLPASYLKKYKIAADKSDK